MQRGPSQSDVSRRGFLGLMGLGAAGLLMGCEAQSAARGPSIVETAAFVDEPPLPSAPLLPSQLAHTPPSVPAAAPNTYGILPRSAWTRVGPNMAHVEPMNGVQMITFHHSGDNEPFYGTTLQDTVAQLQKDWRAHRERGWGDIGYHFGIDRVGRVWQLRSLRYQGAHVWGRDEHNIGVVVLGNFEFQAPTVQQRDRIRVFSPLLRRIYRLPATRIHTHQEIALPGHGTLCPGRHMQPYMEICRNKQML